MSAARTPAIATVRRERVEHRVHEYEHDPRAESYGLEAAERLGVDPEPFVLAVLFGANMSYLTPIGYQTNLMVFSAGGYRFTDFFRAGLPLQQIMWWSLTFLLALFYDLL